MVIHEKNERELQKSMSSKDLRAEDITGSGSYIGAIYQEEVDEGGKFKKKKKKRTTKKDKGGIARSNLRKTPQKCRKIHWLGCVNRARQDACHTT